MSFSFSTNEFGAKCVDCLAMSGSGGGEGGNPLMGLLPFVLIFAAMWFLLIAPQRKKQKQHDQMVQELQPGTDVVTVGGLHGTITSVKEDRFVLKIADNVKVEISKASIADKVNQS
jgi:preprotein translocase subunit YajC